MALADAPRDVQPRLVGDVIGRTIELRLERDGERRPVSVNPVELAS